MSANNQVAGFTPSADGLHFVNSWPSEPDIVVNVPPFGNVAIGDASNGLCGGMVFAVRDFFEAHLPIVPDTTPPAAQSPLFNYIVGRLFDSFNIPGGVLEYYSWMNTPDHDTGVWFAIRRGVAWMTIEQEWPIIRATIDSGHPCPLGLVTVYSTDPALLGHNHQVMAYAYELDDASNLTVKVYDPNTSPASADQVQMSLNISNPSHTTPISHNIAIGLPVRGFFHIDYGPHDPSALEPPPLPSPPPAFLKTTVTPFPVPPGRPVSLIVHAADGKTGAAVKGNVTIGSASVGVTDVPFTYTFRPTVVMPQAGVPAPRPIPNGDPPPRLFWPTGRVTAAGYAPAFIGFGLPEP